MVSIDLYPEEAKTIERAVAKRRHEFAAGRLCARRALAKLGVPAGPLVAGPDRAPAWPAGFVGSITHTADWCGVVVASATDLAGVGIDAEPDQGIEPDLWPRICSPRELAWIERHPVSDRGALARLVFSAKEAFYKCQYLITQQYLGFHDVELAIALDDDTFTATFEVPSGSRFRPGDTIPGRIVRAEGLLVTAAWIETPSS